MASFTTSLPASCDRDFRALRCRAKNQRRGTVSVEYALVLASVIGVLVISASILGPRVRDSLQRVAEIPSQATRTKTMAQVDSTTRVPQPLSAAGATGVSAWVVFGQTAAMLAVISWVLLERRKRLKELDERNAVAGPVFIEDKGRRIFAKRQQIYKILSGNLEALLGSQIEVGHLMSDRVTTIDLHTPASEVRELMDEEHVRHLLVIDRQEKLVGIISDRDLRNQEAVTAIDLMTADPICVSADSLVNPAITQMMKRCISALPVVSDGKVQGVLTTTDLMMTLQCCLQVLQSVAEQVRTPSLAEVSAASNRPAPLTSDATQPPWTQQV